MTNSFKEKIDGLTKQLDYLIITMKPLSIFSHEWDEKVNEYIRISLKISRYYESLKFLR